MSYCRFLEADVYVYMEVSGHLVCCGCSLTDASYFDSTQAMVDHLQEHITAGHHVPGDVIPALRADDAENFPTGATAS